MSEHETIHASTIAIDGRAVMLLGPSGSGKSDLALRLIDRGATLVSDDYTRLDRVGDRLMASAPSTIAGKIELRGLGIAAISHLDDVPVDLAVRLQHQRDRMPERHHEHFLGVPVRIVFLDPRPAAAPLLVEHALRQDLP